MSLKSAVVGFQAGALFAFIKWALKGFESGPALEYISAAIFFGAVFGFFYWKSRRDQRPLN